MRLSPEQIKEIVKAYEEGETRSQIAARMGIDNSTVRFHITRFEDTYGSTSMVYSLVTPQKRPCEHPSLKCLVCGLASDNIRRRELEKIHELTSRLEKANEILKREGYDTV